MTAKSKKLTLPELSQLTKIDTKKLLHSPKHFVYTLNEFGQITYTSDSFKSLGYEIDDLLGMHILEIVHSLDRLRAGFRVNERRTGVRSTKNFIVKILHKPDKRKKEYKENYGHPFSYLSIEASGLREDGMLSGTVGVGVDVTRNMEAYSKLSLMLDALNDGPISVMITNITGIIQHVNENFAELYGYTQKSLIGKDQKTLDSIFVTPEISEKIWKTIRSGKLWSGEICNRKKDGNAIWTMTTIVPTFDSLGDHHNFIVIVEDISSKKITKTKIKNPEENQFSVMESCSEGVVCLDFEGKVTSYNHTAELLLGIKENSKIEDFLSKSDLKKLFKAVDSISSDSNELVLDELVIKNSAGEKLSMAIEIIIGVEEEPNYYIFLRDISERVAIVDSLWHPGNFAKTKEITGKIIHDINYPVKKAHKKIAELEKSDLTNAKEVKKQIKKIHSDLEETVKNAKKMDMFSKFIPADYITGETIDLNDLDGQG